MNWKSALLIEGSAGVTLKLTGRQPATYDGAGGAIPAIRDHFDVPAGGEAETIKRLNAEIAEINTICVEHGDAGKSHVEAVRKAYRAAGDFRAADDALTSAEATVARRDATIKRLREEIAEMRASYRLAYAWLTRILAAAGEGG